jgi:hypothetical protein
MLAEELDRRRPRIGDVSDLRKQLMPSTDGQRRMPREKFVKRKAFIAAAVLLAGGSTYAHHSFTATYDESKTVTIEGELVQFMFRNPHAWVHVMAPDDKGVMQRWGVEWGGAGALTGQGVTRDSLKPGDHVVISGNPGRNASDHRVRMRSLLRPSDGFGWGFQGETFD